MGKPHNFVQGMIATLTVEGPGWVEVTTGGDCRALELRVPGRFALLTDGDYHVPTASTSPVTIGVYDENGEILVETTAPSLHTAKAWCERVLLPGRHRRPRARRCRIRRTCERTIPTKQKETP